MHRGLKYTFIFAAGAAIGSLVTWKFLDSRYKNILKEEEEAIRMYYSNKAESDDSDYFVYEDEENKEDLQEEAKNILTECGYTTKENIEKEDKSMEPYIITPDELGELDGYDIETLYYHADNVLVDDTGTPIEDVEGLVGVDFPDYFGEYEDDAVYVRNDRLRCDYEILRDLSNYSETKRPVYAPEEDE